MNATSSLLLTFQPNHLFLLYLTISSTLCRQVDFLSTYIYTHKLQVHSYKPVSWSPTHQEILLYLTIYLTILLYLTLSDEWATTKQACRNELVVYVFFSSVYISLYFYVLSTVLRKSSFTLYIYIYIYIYNCRQYCFGLLGLISAVLMSRMEVKL